MSAEQAKDLATRRFRWAVQALALGAEEQRRVFPEFVEVADELALEHEETQAAFLSLERASLAPQQSDALARLDQLLDRMSGAENSAYWTDAALDSAPEWEQVRGLAAVVLRVMGWPLEPPPQQRATYVGLKRSTDP